MIVVFGHFESMRHCEEMARHARVLFLKQSLSEGYFTYTEIASGRSSPRNDENE